MVEIKKIYRAIGLMSGTSMDGVDAAIIETDGEKLLSFGATHFKEYPGWMKLKMRKLISDVQRANRNPQPSDASPRSRWSHSMTDSEWFYTKEVEKDITKFHIEAVEELVIKAELKPEDIDVVGFHGHTIDHRPHEKFTWQIGDGALLAEKCGIDVVCDFRSNDVDNGGQGAPLMPIYHQAIIDKSFFPAAIVNIGGVSNISYIDGKKLVAFDCGPGNALIDDIIYENTERHFDDGGKIALQGRVNGKFLSELLKDKYFKVKPPKSLDRNEFNTKVTGLLQGKYKTESFINKVSTLTEFTVRAIVRSAEHLPRKPKMWFISGGGVHNKYIMQSLHNILDGKVAKISKLSDQLDPNFIEAQGFAFLAVRSILELPISFPGTTGVKNKTGLAGGVLFRKPASIVVLAKAGRQRK